jgi:hypothetical protein
VDTTTGENLTIVEGLRLLCKTRYGVSGVRRFIGPNQADSATSEAVADAALTHLQHCCLTKVLRNTPLSRIAVAAVANRREDTSFHDPILLIAMINVDFSDEQQSHTFK